MNVNLLDELLAATELANYHFLILMSLRLTAIRMERVLAEHGDLKELDELVDKRNELNHTRQLIEAIMWDYYLSDWRVN